jgi:hypothetical protein
VFKAAAGLVLTVGISSASVTGVEGGAPGGGRHVPELPTGLTPTTTVIGIP